MTEGLYEFDIVEAHKRAVLPQAIREKGVVLTEEQVAELERDYLHRATDAEEAVDMYVRVFDLPVPQAG